MFRLLLLTVTLLLGFLAVTGAAIVLTQQYLVDNGVLYWTR